MCEPKYTYDSKSFYNFIGKLKNCKKLHEPLVKTLGNIFSMRSIGNKTHGDLAEVGITEFINQFMDDYECLHVGKLNYRKTKKASDEENSNNEEDIAIRDKVNGDGKYIPVSLKAYGIGPLQLSTDRDYKLFPLIAGISQNELMGMSTKEISNRLKGKIITNSEELNTISDFIINNVTLNVLPLIYNENTSEDSNDMGVCNLMLFDCDKMRTDLKKIVFVGNEYEFKDKNVKKQTTKKKRKNPIFLFLNNKDEYICEVRYGHPQANALQRGMWGNTGKRGENYFTPLFDDWIPYQEQKDLITLIRRALNSTTEGHTEANKILLDNINQTKNKFGI